MIRLRLLIRSFSITIILSFCVLAHPSVVTANPFFYLTGEEYYNEGDVGIFKLFLNSDGSQLETVQIAIQFDEEYWDFHALNVQNSVCSSWKPAVSIPPGENFERTTPYYYGSKLIFACSFPESKAYDDDEGLIAIFSLKAKQKGYTAISFVYPSFQFLGTIIKPGAMDSFRMKIGEPDGTPPPQFETNSTFAPAIPFYDGDSSVSSSKTITQTPTNWVFITTIGTLGCIFAVNTILWLIRKRKA
ncbi:MAG: hypothetical protein ACOX6V_02565 [Patescibacteria group bacterium]|jgi:hypothetical protein